MSAAPWIVASLHQPMDQTPPDPKQNGHLWFFRATERIYTRTLFLKRSTGADYFVFLLTENCWPFLYLDTAYWHTVHIHSKSQSEVDSQRANYLERLQATATPQLLDSPSCVAQSPSGIWDYVCIASDEYRKEHDVSLPSDSYLSPFRDDLEKGRHSAGVLFIEYRAETI